MPRNLTASTARLDPAAKAAEQYRLLPLAEYLVPDHLLNPAPRDDLDGLPSWERDEVLDAEFAAEHAEDRFLGWQLGCLDEMGGPATDAELARWTARIEKTDRKAAKARKKAEKAARKAAEKTSRARESSTALAGAPILPPPPHTDKENDR